MIERRRVLSEGAIKVTLRVTTTDGSTNVGIEMTVVNDGVYYPVTTDSQGYAELEGLFGGCTISCETYELSISQFTVTGPMTIDISAYLNTFPIGTKRDYSYTATVQSVSLIPGTYKLQVWGAQGGSNAAYSSYSISAQTGGKGGYSEGILTINSPQTLYVFVGGQGSSSGNGGWNGGGGGGGTTSYNSGNTYGYTKVGCGGGATDIALTTSTMSYSSYRTNRTSASYLSRFIVAGGGSGGAMSYTSVTTSTSVQVNDATNTSPIQADSGFYFVVVNLSVTSGRTYYITGVPSGFSPTWKFTKTADPWTGDASYAEGTAVTAPSGWPYLSIYLYNASATPSGYRIVVYHYENQSSTTTSNNSSTGYVGGGTSGGGSYPGTQSSAGSNGGFGYGANQQATNNRYHAGLGGGGWYGGGSLTADSSPSSYIYYSGGGSGFVNTSASASYRPSGYIGLELDSGQTIAGSSTFESTSGSTETGHSGNGYARITRLDPSTMVPLTFTILESGTIGWKCNSSSYARTIQYSKNGGAWTSITSTTSGVTISVSQGDVIQFKGSNTYYCYSSYYNYFTATCRFNASGNIMSLVSISSTMLTQSYMFGYLFYNNTKLVDASGLQLPATTLTQFCYQYMFYGCTGMTKAPEILPATTLQNYCYYYMFYGCTSLQKAPELPAQTLTTYCYYYMFQNCSSLNYVNAAFTTTPSTSYTQNWLSGVAATGIFVKSGVATWTTTGVSAVPTGWTVEYHNDEMGYFTIESLEDNNTIKWYKSSSSATSKTIYWAKGNTAFTSISSTTSGATLTTLNRGEKLYIWGSNTQYASSTSYYSYFRASANYKVYGNIMSLINGSTFKTLTYFSNHYVFTYLFYNDTHIIDASGLLLPVTTLSCQYVYAYMFYGCSGLTAAPELPATILYPYCYSYMFYGCTALTKAPVLPATSLTSYCYNYMFQNCSSLKYIKALFTTTPSTSFTSNWVNGVAAAGTFVKNSSATWTTTGVSAIPSGWTVQTASS